MMNENDFGSEKVLRAINHLYMMQVCICIAALKELRSAELTDKNIILRAIMRDMPDCGICADLTAEDYGVDFWADRAEYVNESTFNLYVTQAEENVLWNIEKKGQKPGRLAVPQQRITVRGDGARLMDGCLPTLIQWGAAHPCDSLPASGVQLEQLALQHPQAATLQAAYAADSAATLDALQQGTDVLAQVGAVLAGTDGEVAAFHLGLQPVLDGVFCQRLQNQLWNQAGEQLILLHMERIFETSCIPDAENGKIIFQIFQLFLHGDIFVLIRERILKKTAERLDSVTDDLVIVHGCHKAQTV